MHNFLSAIGFSNIKNRRLLEPVYKQILGSPTKKSISNISADTQLIQLDKDFGDDFGISLLGERSIDGSISIEHYFPYVKSNIITWQNQIFIEKHGDKEAYAGISEDLNLGMSLIFFLQNISDYVQSQWMNRSNRYIDHVYLSALSTSGKIILDVASSDDSEEKKQADINRRNLIEAAKNGDSAALENLTIEDMDIYSTIRRRLNKEDILSIVTSCFMPYGIETEHYSIIGTIINSELKENSFSGEKIYLMVVEANDIMMQLAINQNDLMGEPLPGRRFKGEIWLQGRISI